MQIGIVGLGRMGGNIAVRLTRHGHDVVVYDRDTSAVEKLWPEQKLDAPQQPAIWPMWWPS